MTGLTKTVGIIAESFGNALIEKAYADYEYKTLSKGEQEIDGQKYKLPEDFYATVKREPSLRSR